MNETGKTNFKRELESLATIRDELKLKAHLAKNEIRDELERLERKWLLADEELQRAKTHAKEDVDSISKSAKELLLDLKQGYESVKRRLV